MRENDWIVAGLNNPNFSSNDFRNILGMTPENTQILSASDYKKSQFVRDRFKNTDGTFDEAGFDNYYRQRLAEFNKFDENDLLIDNFEYSLADTRRKADSRTKSLNFTIQRVSNPDRETIGIAGQNAIGERKFTRAELAQTQPIFDTETGQYLNKTPNDNAFVNNPFKWIGSFFQEPLVMAQYEEDGTHIDPITGEEVQHRKHDYKLNSDGQYYYETLNGRSLIGKEILSNFDIFTIDGEGVNRYDFLDADGLDKSVEGSIAKMAFTIAPMFIPYVGQYYSYALVARELSKSLPMMYGMATSLFGNDEDSQVINTIAAIGHKFSTGTSEYAKQHTFAFENFANLIADVATQWGQQKAIANTINNLRGSKAIMEKASEEALQAYRMGAANVLNDVSMGRMSIDQGARYLGVKSLNWKEIEEVMMKGWDKTPLGQGAIKTYLKPAEQIARNRSRLGADAALAYMAIVSNTDVYDTLLQNGAQKRDAALVALGSTLGMFGVDRYLHLGEAFFDGLTSESSLAIRGVFRNEAKNWTSTLIDINGGVKDAASRIGKNKAGELITKGINLGKNATNKYIEGLQHHSLGFFGKALTEGIEEVNEELVTDLAKQFYEIAGTFSPNFFNRSGISDVGAWDNALERYVMNFLGGFMGGGIFYGVDVVQNGNFTLDHSKEDLMYLVSNHRTSELLTELDKWHKNGKLGNTNLSATRTDETADGKKVYLTVQPGEESQNDFIYNRIKEEIIQLETILNASGLNLGEDELYKQMVLGEDRFMALQSELQGVSYSTNYQNEFRNMARKYIEAKNALEAARKSVDGTPGGAELTDAQKRDNILMNDPTRLRNIQNLEQEFEKINQERIEFLQGNKSLEYTDKMLFAIDPNLRGIFVSMTFEEYVKNNKHKNVEDLTEAELKTYSEEYLEYKKSAQKLNLSQQYEIYKKIKEKVDPFIQGIADQAPNYQTVNEALKSFFDDSKNSVLNKFTINTSEDTPLEGETEEDYQYRNTKKEGESEAEFIIRRTERLQKVYERILKAGEQLIQDINEIFAKTGGQIDPVTSRYIHERLANRKKDIINEIITNNIDRSLYDTESNSKNQIIEVINSLKEDLSNKSEISKKIEDILLKDRIEELKNSVNQHFYINSGFSKLFKAFNYSFEENNITAANIADFLYDLAEKIESGDEETKKTFDKLGMSEIYDDLANSGEEIYEKIKKYKFGEDSLLEAYFGEEAGFDESIEPILNSALANIKLDGSENSGSYAVLSEEEIENKAKEDISTINDEYQRMFSDILSQISENNILNVFYKIDNLFTKDSIVKDLLSHITKQVLGNSEDVEQILQRIFDRLQGVNDKNDFKIEDVDLNTINQVEYILNLAKAYLYASSFNPNYSTPVGHNAVLNDFAEKHKDLFQDWNPLPQLQEDVAAMAMNEIQKYIKELNILRNINETNRINKSKKLIDTYKKFTDARIKFFETSKNDLKFTLNEKVIDLLEGSEALNDSDKDIYIHNLENILYKNIHKLLDSGISFTDILENSNILQHLTNIENVVKQKTDKLDDKIENLTDYGKFTYLLTIAGLSANDFEYFNKIRIEQNTNDENRKIAPLTIQQYVSRIGMAKLKNPKIFEEGVKYLKKVTGDSRPFLDQIVFIDGGAGVGKSQVCAKNVQKFSEFLDPKSVTWLAAPGKTQLDNLFDAVGVGVTFTRQDLFNKIVDPATYSEIMTSLKGNGKGTNTDYYSYSESIESEIYTLKPDKIKFNTKDAPKLLIIDEITHFSGIELQLLNEWARQSGTTIITLGDINQNGFSEKSANLGRESIFAIRAPKLMISLRDVNIQKSDNLTSLINIINDLIDTEQKSESDPEYDDQIKSIRNRIKNIQLKVYNQENDINGDLITDKLTEDLAQKLSGEVAYVGDTSSETYNTLKEVVPADKLHVLTPEEIQGQEYDYIVIDKDWSKNTFGKDFNINTSKEIEVLRFLRNLYTLISRGKSASIIINNGLTDTILPNKIEFNQALAPNLRDAIDTFKENELARIEKLSLLSPEEFANQNSEISTPTSTTPEKSNNGENLGEKAQEEEIREYSGVIDTEQSKTDSTDDKKIIDEVFGNDDNLGQEWEETEASLTGTPIRVYSSAHLSGLSVLPYTKPDGTSENYWINNRTLITSEFNPNSLDLENYIYVAHQTMLDAAKNIVKEGFDSKAGLAGTTVFVNPENLSQIMRSQLEGHGHNGSNAIVLFKFPKDQFYKEKLQLDDISDKLNELGYSFTKVPSKYIDKIITTNKTEIPNVKRNIEIFTDKSVISEGSEKDVLTRQLLGLKSLILFKHSYAEAPSYITKVISEEDFNNIKYKIVVRKKSDSDNFVGYTGLKADEMADKDGLVYTIIAQIGNNEITLGLLADPNKYANSRDSILESIRRTINKLDKSNPKYKERLNNLEKRRDTLDQHIKDYGSLINQLSNNAKNNNSYYEVEVNPSFSALSYIRRQSQGKPIIPQQLNIDEISGFRKSHPYLVISKPQIYIGKNNEGISDANRGKAVVFVSSDTLLSPDELMDEYINSKQKTTSEGNDAFHLSTVTPRVRMIILNSKGLTLKELTHTNLKDLFKSEYTLSNGTVIHNILPFEEDYMGARMITSLWNWRANLNKFIQKYNKFKKEKGYTDEQLQQIALVADALYRRDNDEYMFNILDKDIDILKLYGTVVTEQQVKDLNEFNDSLASQVRQFRLGGSLKYSGAYIRKLTKIEKGNIFYEDNTKPYGIYLTPNAAIEYYNLTQALFDTVLNKVVTLKDENDKSWSPDKLITTKKKDGKNYQNSISNLIRSGFANQIITLHGDIQEETVINPETGEQEVKYSIDDSEYKLKMPEKGSLVHIPIILCKLYKRAAIFKNMTDDSIPEFINDIKIGEGDKELQINIKNVLKYETPSGEEDVTKRSSLDYLLSLAFHGTTSKLSNDVPKATDAYFKQGFFADPFSSKSVKSDVNSGKWFAELVSNEALFEVNCEIDMPVFDVVIEQIREQIKKQNNSNKDLEINAETQKVFDSLKSLEEIGLLDIEDLGDYIKTPINELKVKVSKLVNEAILDHNKTHFNNIASSAEDILNFPYIYNDEEMTVQTIGQYILKEYGRDDYDLSKSSLEKDVFQLPFPNNQSLIITKLFDGNLKFEDNFEKKESSNITANTVPSENPITETSDQSGSEKPTDNLSKVKGIVSDWYKNMDNDIKEEAENGEAEGNFKNLIQTLKKYSDIQSIKETLMTISKKDISPEFRHSIAEVLGQITIVEDTEITC